MTPEQLAQMSETDLKLAFADAVFDQRVAAAREQLFQGEIIRRMNTPSAPTATDTSTIPGELSPAAEETKPTVEI